MVAFKKIDRRMEQRRANRQGDECGGADPSEHSKSELWGGHSGRARQPKRESRARHPGSHAHALCRVGSRAPPHLLDGETSGSCSWEMREKTDGEGEQKPPLNPHDSLTVNGRTDSCRADPLTTSCSRSSIADRTF
jgi:hypothetical protein